jgi:hypothetical protein
MNEMSQLATAMVAVVFSTVMLVSGQLFIEYRSTKNPVVGSLVAATLRADRIR